MTIKEKILTYLEIKGIKKTEFFKATGIASSNFKGAAKQSELGSDKLANILTIYKELSPEWLLLDKGDMLLSNNNTEYRSKFSNEGFASLLSMLKEKDNTIQIQAEEIGRLKNIIEHLEEERHRDVSNAPSSVHANIG